jgi:uncharacterized protein (TIGR02217 family)
MMFLEESLPIDARTGAAYGDRYGVEAAKDPRTGKTYTRLRAPQPAREFSIHYTLDSADLWDRLLDLYHRAHGPLAGFRVKFIDDFSSNGNTAAPTALDQALEYISSGVYQLQKKYGAGGTPLDIGLPVRTITKPVAGSVLVAVDGAPQASGWSVDTTTGLVTFATPPASNAVVTGGFLFDIPCRFSDKFDINHIAYGYRDTGTIILEEIINP